MDRPARDQSLKIELSTAATIPNEQTSNSIDSSSELPPPPLVQQVDIEHRGLSLEDRRNSAIPPPSDGKSYTPEEFTSLIVAGYSVTPIPDLSYGAAASNFVNSYGSTAAPPIAPPPFLPGVSSPSPFTARDDNAKVNQARLELGLHHYRQRLAVQQSLPPPKNSKGYTPEEFNGLIAAGYAVSPVPVNQYGDSVTQSRSRLYIKIYTTIIYLLKRL